MCKTSNTEHPMTKEEIERTKDVLGIMSNSSGVDISIKNYIKKALELIVRFQVESIRATKRAEYYKNRYEDIKNKENKK